VPPLKAYLPKGSNNSVDKEKAAGGGVWQLSFGGRIQDLFRIQQVLCPVALKGLKGGKT